MVSTRRTKDVEKRAMRAPSASKTKMNQVKDEMMQSLHEFLQVLKSYNSPNFQFYVNIVIILGFLGFLAQANLAELKIQKVPHAFARDFYHFCNGLIKAIVTIPAAIYTVTYNLLLELEH